MFDLDKYNLTEDEWKRIRAEWKKHDNWVALCRKVIPQHEFTRMTPAERANNYVRMWLEVTKHIPPTIERDPISGKVIRIDQIDIDDVTNRLTQAGWRV